MFDIIEEKIDPDKWRAHLAQSEQSGAFCSFEGWIRRQNDAKEVHYLQYSTYAELAKTQGNSVIERAKAQFAIEDAVCVHRVGQLAVGDMAVWIGVSAGHRDAAFAACRFIIDTVKAEVPIWKHEFYVDHAEQSAWLANEEAQ